jgi:uncharacterized protein (DUF427 family)
MARAVWHDAVLAEGDDVVVVDGYTYFRTSDVHWELLEASEHRSACPWKGEARYYTVHAAGATNPDAAWEYAEPKPAAAMVRDRIAFWRGVVVVP